MDILNLPLISRTLILAIVFVTVMAAALAVSSMITTRLALRRRLSEELRPAAAVGAEQLRRDGNHHRK